MSSFRFFVLPDPRETLMRKRGGSLSVPEVWNGSEWSDYPSGLHGITGVGEDTLSQGECADPISEEKAGQIAAQRGIDLHASGAREREVRVERRADFDLTDFQNTTVVKQFEGGVIYTATGAGKPVLILDESTLADLLNEEDRAGLSFVSVIKFENAAERQNYIERRFR
ncbi:MAG: hypothetical protein ABIR38_00495 [Chthoniobacterales bacterium]